MDIIDYADGSFKSIDFFIEYEGGLSPSGPDVVEEFTIHHIEHSDDGIFQTNGRITRQLELPVAVTATQYDALTNAVGTPAGTLVYHEGTLTARLVAVRRPRKVARHDLYKMVLSFVVTG